MTIVQMVVMIMAVYKWLLGAVYEKKWHTGLLFMGWCVDMEDIQQKYH